MSSPPPRKRVRQRSSVVNNIESSEMFDEVPPSSAATPATATSTTGSNPSGSGQRASRGRMRMQKTKKSSKSATNGHSKVTAAPPPTASSGNSHEQEANSDSSDLEDALGSSPTETTSALLRKLRKKSGLNSFDQELMRIVGQHLHNIGLKTSAKVLMAEAGCEWIHPTAEKFKSFVLNGEWSQALKTLEELKNHLENKDCLVEMKFILLEQKFLELISKGKRMDALKVLQTELSVLKHNQTRVHELSTYLMLSKAEEIARATRSHQGSRASDAQARLDLMHRLQAFIPASVMLPPRRLMTLLDQSAEFQTDRCLRHPMKGSGVFAPPDPSYLTKDHKCPEEDFPCETIQVLTEHNDEVWFCRFSPDGLKLASGGKGKHVCIFDFDPETMTLKFARSFDRRNHGVGNFAWSPDSTKLAVCGPEDCDEVLVWNVETEDLEFKISHSSEDSLTTVAWSPDGRLIACGGQRGQFYQCDNKGNVLHHKEGVRVKALAYRKDNKTILAADTHHRIRAYNLEDETSDKTILAYRMQDNLGIMSFSVDESDRYVLLNLAHQGIHLWSIEDKCLIRQYTGVKQGRFMVHSCFGGGQDNSFFATGSEDWKVYVYHMMRENPIAELSGHTSAVNCVAWNPVYPKVLVSASDDSTLRVWGPSSRFRNGSASGVRNGHDVMAASASTPDDPYHCGNGVI